jgi:hypothetical protein
VTDAFAPEVDRGTLGRVAQWVLAENPHNTPPPEDPLAPISPIKSIVFKASEDSHDHVAPGQCMRQPLYDGLRALCAVGGEGGCWVQCVHVVV